MTNLFSSFLSTMRTLVYFSVVYLKMNGRYTWKIFMNRMLHTLEFHLTAYSSYICCFRYVSSPHLFYVEPPKSALLGLLIDRLVHNIGFRVFAHREGSFCGGFGHWGCRGGAVHWRRGSRLSRLRGLLGSHGGGRSGAVHGGGNQRWETAWHCLCCWSVEELGYSWLTGSEKDKLCLVQ